MSASKTSQATRLVELAEDFHLWRSPDGEPFASLLVRDHWEHWPTGSTVLKRHLARLYFEAERTAPNAEAIRSALAVIEGNALHGEQCHPTQVRVGRPEESGLVYLDLGWPDWRVVEVGVTGWHLIESRECPVRFRRANGMRPLPIPEHGGSIDELRPFLNVESDADFALVVAWLVGALRPSGIGGYPLLALHGEQGSGKSEMARLLRGLLDPNGAPLRAEPRDGRDLMIAARNGWVVALDNLSHVSGWLSDGLCRLATGGGFTTRALYTDADETIFESTRPIVLTGISELAERSDLLDRAIVLTLPRLTDRQRRTEAELRADLEGAAPRILGALLSAVAEALRNEGRVAANVPRMADFAKWVIAAEPALPWAPGAFLLAYRGNRSAANESALEGSLVAAELLRLLAQARTWEGTPSALLAAIEKTAEEKTRRASPWPKNPRALSAHLGRIAPNLRAAGIAIEWGKCPGSGSRRWISLARECLESSDASDASDARSARCDASDASFPAPTGGPAAEEVF